MSISTILNKLGFFKTQPENLKVKQDHTMEQATTSAPSATNDDLTALSELEPLTLDSGNPVPTIKIR